MIWDDNPKTPVACTDNTMIMLNAGSSTVQCQKTRNEKFLVLVGLFFHEIGHQLFTSFQSQKLFRHSIGNGKWYPREPDIGTNLTMLLNKNAIEEYITDPKQAHKFLAVAHRIENIMEDGRIESLLYTLCSNYGRLTNSLNFLRDYQFESMLSSKTCGEKKLMMISFINLIH